MGATVDRIWQYAATDPIDPAGLHLLLNALGDSIRKNLPRAGSVTLPTPDTTLKTTVATAYPGGPTFLAGTATVIPTQVITATGIIVNVQAVSLGTTTFQLRYKASAAVGADAVCAVIVAGTLA